MMKDEISKIVLDTMTGIRTGVGNARKQEFNDYVQSLIEAKKQGVDIDLIQNPMLADRVKQGIEAYLFAQTKGGAEGGITWNILSLKGNYGTEKEESIKVNVEMDFESIGYPSYGALKTSSVEDLENLVK